MCTPKDSEALSDLLISGSNYFRRVLVTLWLCRGGPHDDGWGCWVRYFARLFCGLSSRFVERDNQTVQRARTQLSHGICVCCVAFRLPSASPATLSTACSCKMAIAFAKLSSLDCTDPTCSRDFTLHPFDENSPEAAVPSQSTSASTMQTQIAYPGTQAYDRLTGGVVDPSGGGNVLLVNHLDERVKPDELFNLFGTCGDVMKVKILFNKRDSALLEFRNPAQAKCAKVCWA